jgi:tetratricopeptide (TPR) repeat protein
MAIEAGIQKRIAYLRKYHNKSQGWLGDKIWLTQSHVAKIENGHHELTDSTASLTAEVFQLPQSYFTITGRDSNLDEKLEGIFEKILQNDTEGLEVFFFFFIYNANLRQELGWMLLKVSYLFQIREYQEAERLICSYLDTFLNDGIKGSEATNLRKYYYLYLYEANLKENRLTECQRLLNLLLKETKTGKQKAKLLIMKAQVSFRNSKYGKALKYADEAVSLAKYLEADKLLSHSLVIKSALFIHLKLYDESLEVLESLKEVLRNSDFEHFRAAAHQHKGLILSQRKMFPESYLNYEKAYELSKTPEGTMTILVSMIICKIKLEDYQKAIELIDVGIGLEQTEYDKMILLSLECEIDLYTDYIRSHKRKLKKILEYFIGKNHLDDLNYIYAYLADYYLKNQQYKEAAKYFGLKEKILDEKN